MGKSDQKLTQAQIDAIKSYGDEIVTISDFVEIVRKRPGMYLGPIGDPGFINMIREILQNAFDQIMKPNSPATYAIVSYDELTHEVIIEDNGMGIPFGSIIRAFTSQHTSSHFEAQKGVFQAGLHGVGSKVTNAMSSHFKVQSYVLGEGREVEFIDGKPISDKEKVIKNNGKQGTIVSFIPSIDALGPINVSCDDVLNLIRTILPLVKEGTIVVYNCMDRERNQRTVQLENTDGIAHYMDGFVPVLKNHIYINDISDEMKMECMFNFDSGFNSNVICFANFCPTVKGTHLDGFVDGVAYWFKNYMNNIFLNSGKASSISKKKQVKKDKVFTIELVDIKSALRGVIHAAHIEPNFTGQAKEILSNAEMYGFVKNGVSKGLDEWAAKNPSDLQKVCKFIKDIAELRQSESTTRLKLSNKYASAVTGYPKKFKKPTGPKSCWEEFWVCEGVA